MVIRFHPGRLGIKPDALTHWPDLYPKGEGKPYGTVNPRNCHPVFSSTQLSAFLQATAMLPVALRGIITMDINVRISPSRTLVESGRTPTVGT
jgi:hypothetical protein